MMPYYSMTISTCGIHVLDRQKKKKKNSKITTPHAPHHPNAESHHPYIQPHQT